VTPGSAAEAPRRALSELNCPHFDSLDQVIRILRGFFGARPMAKATVAVRPAEIPAALDLKGLSPGRLTEPEAKRLLAQYGVPVTRESVVRDAEQAAAAARTIGFPVALKAVARDLVHKSDIGAVKLRLGDEFAIKKAWNEVAAAVRSAMPGSTLDGCVVQEMVRGEAELIIGARRDPQFGPVVLVGFGGVMVEVLEDIQLALAPVSKDEALAMLHRLKLWPVLNGARGRAKLDVDAVADALCRLGWLAADLGGSFGDIEVNPLMVRVAGQGVVAADARGTLLAPKSG
jgi:acetyl-CoA synthetase (ADP-forming)